MLQAGASASAFVNTAPAVRSHAENRATTASTALRKDGGSSRRAHRRVVAAMRRLAVGLGEELVQTVTCSRSWCAVALRRCSGGELFYRSGDRMMVVSVTTAPAFRASAPKVLWEGKYSRGLGSSCGMPGAVSSNYDVTSDGQRFLMVRDDDDVAATRIVVVLNWMEELKRAAAGRHQLRFG